jgi:hypothetical protein
MNCFTDKGFQEMIPRIPTWVFEGWMYDQFKIGTASVISNSQNSVADKNSPRRILFGGDCVKQESQVGYQ